MSDSPMDDAPDNVAPEKAASDDRAPRAGAPERDRVALEAAVVESVSMVPGVARLVPSFRQVLTAAAQRLLNSETTPATGVDIVSEATGVVVYVDLYIDGTRPAGVVVDDVDAQVQALMVGHDGAPARVKVRVMGVMDAG
ncbi:hypothetical protein [Nesterenkonia sp. CF4.4]|uniref:hypothetical protein n=1 Tax=Nesterenkonia sp. CF4.4 TaxID=3373079 RepID=UPI003EE7B381